MWKHVIISKNITIMTIFIHNKNKNEHLQLDLDEIYILHKGKVLYTASQANNTLVFCSSV